jgi:uncharacterized lipoprotein NlpE involved in copper resistance
MVRSFIFSQNGNLGVAAFAIILLVVLGCNTRSDEEWTNLLGDRSLTKASTSGAISDRVTLYFCPNGDYARVFETSGFSGGGGGTLSMADRSIEAGRWQVRGGKLILASEDGDQHEYSLYSGMEENVVQLNGTPYLLGQHEECKSGS